MLSALINILNEGITEGDDPPLKSNGLARRLLQFILNNEEAPDFLRLLSQFIKINHPTKFDDWEKQEKHIDLRIKHLLLKNVRQYCLYSDKAEGFCLDLTISDRPCSHVFLGSNGTGKSTLFASLEYLYLGFSEIASSHSHADDILDFFRSINKPVEEIELIGNFNDEIVIEENKIEGYEIPSAFCSENDYFQISREWRNITPYVAKQIGFQEVWKFLQDLRKLSEFLQYSSEYQKREYLISRAETRQREFEENSKDWKIIGGYINAIKREKTSINSRFLSNGGSKYYKHISRFIKEIDKCPDLLANKTDLSNLLHFMEKKWQEIMNVMVSIMTSVVPAVLESNLKKGKEDIVIEGNNGNLTIDLYVKPLNLNSEGTEEIRNPIEYFNTFRLKLFCIALKLSMLCCSKIFHKANIPFFVDDIFDSSDFNHRVGISKFMIKMLEAHDLVMKSHSLEALENLPLQLIFFTQDNIIGENVYKALLRWSDENGLSNEYGVKYERLFTPVDAIIENPKKEGDQCDIKQVTINSSPISVINISDPL